MKVDIETLSDDRLVDLLRSVVSEAKNRSPSILQTMRDAFKEESRSILDEFKTEIRLREQAERNYLLQASTLVREVPDVITISLTNSNNGRRVLIWNRKGELLSDWNIHQCKLTTKHFLNSERERLRDLSIDVARFFENKDARIVGWQFA